MNESADVIVIGAGIHGASTAFHLAQRGVSVTVLEQSTAGSAATGRSSGLVRMHYDLAAESALAWLSYGYFRDWSERVGGECGFVRTGFLRIVPPAWEPALRANVADQAALGIPTSVVGAADVRDLAPGLAADDFEVAAYEPESGYADPTGSCTSGLAAARRLGATMHQGRPCAGRGPVHRRADRPRWRSSDGHLGLRSKPLRCRPADRRRPSVRRALALNGRAVRVDRGTSGDVTAPSTAG